MKIKYLSENWNELLKSEFEKEYYLKLRESVNSAYKTQIVFPPPYKVFKALQCCELENIKLVIIGQDPYHGIEQANGLCFSVNSGIPVPPSLRNIFKEIKSNYPDFEIPNSGDLTAWANQGVLLLNAVLTVESGKPGSHKNFGWETFTDNLISKLSETKSNLVFLLWGSYAKSKAILINQEKHKILTSAHPSFFSCKNFFGNNHFKLANDYLKENNLKEIEWNL